MWQSFAQPTGGACRANFLCSWPANKVMTPTQTHTHTHKCFRFGQSEQRAAPCEIPASSEAETRKLPQFNLAKKAQAAKAAGGRKRGKRGGGTSAGRCCQLCEILVRKQSEKDFCNLFKSRATFSIQAKAMSRAGGRRCRRSSRRSRSRRRLGIFSYLQQ